MGISKKVRDKFEAVKALYKFGVSKNSISEQLKIGHKTVDLITQSKDINEYEAMRKAYSLEQMEQKRKKQDVDNEPLRLFEPSSVDKIPTSGDSQIVITASPEFIELIFRLVQAIPGVVAGASI